MYSSIFAKRFELQWVPFECLLRDFIQIAKIVEARRDVRLELVRQFKSKTFCSTAIKCSNNVMLPNRLMLCSIEHLIELNQKQSQNKLKWIVEQSYCRTSHLPRNCIVSNKKRLISYKYKHCFGILKNCICQMR